MIVEDHADLLDNLAIEAGCLNANVNLVSTDAYSNTRLLVNGLKDDTKRESSRRSKSR